MPHPVGGGWGGELTPGPQLTSGTQSPADLKPGERVSAWVSKGELLKATLSGILSLSAQRGQGGASSGVRS